MKISTVNLAAIYRFQNLKHSFRVSKFNQHWVLLNSRDFDFSDGKKITDIQKLDRLNTNLRNVSNKLKTKIANTCCFLRIYLKLIKTVPLALQKV